MLLSKILFDLQPGYMEADSNPNTSKLWCWDLLICAISKLESERERVFLRINLDGTVSLIRSSAGI